MKSMSVKPFVIISLLAAPVLASAQTGRIGDTVLKGSTIEVLQSYKPKVKQSPKPEWIPQLPAADTSHPTFNYDVPQQTLNYSYSSAPLRPLALGKNVNDVPFQNYVKVGAGNLSTLYGDAGIGGIHGENYETGLHLHHLSQKGSIKNQRSSLSGLEADGVFHQPGSEWRASIAAAHDQYCYYGYDHLLHDFAADSVKQAYTSGRISVDMVNKADTAAHTRLFYHPKVDAYYYGARYNTSEVSAAIEAPFTYQLNELLMAVGFTNGAKDVTEANVSAYYVPVGTEGNMGSAGYGNTYARLEGDPSEFKAWKIASGNGNYMYLMAKCGNAFFPNSRKATACVTAPVNITTDPKELTLTANGQTTTSTDNVYVYYHRKHHKRKEAAYAVAGVPDPYPSAPLLLNTDKKVKAVPETYKLSVNSADNMVTVCPDSTANVAANISVEKTSEYTGNYTTSNKMYKKVSKHAYKKSMRKLRKAERKERKIEKATGVPVKHD